MCFDNTEPVIDIPEIKAVFYHEYSKDFQFFGEMHGGWEMVYVDRGEVIVNANETVHILRQGEIIFHKPYAYHNIGANKKAPANVFIIIFETQSKLMDYFEHRVLKVSGEPKQYICKILNEANFALASSPESALIPFGDNLKPDTARNPESLQLITMYLKIFLILLFRGENETKNSYLFSFEDLMDNRVIAKLIKHLEDNLYNDLSVNEICEKMHYGKSYLYNKFKEATGFSIRQYYINMKIEEAKNLIRENKYNFTQIAQILKFDSQNYFSRTFRRLTGMTPIEYKKSASPTTCPRTAVKFTKAK